MPKRTIQPHALLDFLIEEKGMKNDAAIARILGINPSVLSKIRKGDRKYPVSPEIRLGVMRNFGLSLKRVDELAPPVVSV